MRIRDRQRELEVQLPELVALEKLIPAVEPWGSVQRELVVSHRGHELPVLSFRFGSSDPAAPVLLLVAGVHGLERIGTRVVTAYLTTFLELLTWDTMTREMLRGARVVFYPLVNPAGMFSTTRSNGNGVDLMRNAPVEMEKPSRWRLFEGHRLSARLPWYRGDSRAMEPEAAALCAFVEREIAGAPLAVSLDVHSGFGAVDRLWFPYAKTREPFSRLAEAYRLKHLLDRTYPNHVYRVEPQSHQYTTHGDLWDFLFDRFEAVGGGRLFLPLCLEMGSWIWVKKNPRQLLSLLGAFNPLLPHRKQRTLRRHIFLFDFLLRAVRSPAWAGVASGEREACFQEAVGHWYGGPGGR